MPPLTKIKVVGQISCCQNATRFGFGQLPWPPPCYCLAWRSALPAAVPLFCTEGNVCAACPASPPSNHWDWQAWALRLQLDQAWRHIFATLDSNDALLRQWDQAPLRAALQRVHQAVQGTRDLLETEELAHFDEQVNRLCEGDAQAAAAQAAVSSRLPTLPPPPSGLLELGLASTGTAQAQEQEQGAAAVKRWAPGVRVVPASFERWVQATRQLGL